MKDIDWVGCTWAAFIFWAFWCILTPSAFADRVDILESMTDKDYCSVVADQFYAGVQSQQSGHKRELRHASKEILELAEHGQLPKDAMYVPEWDELSDRDKAFITQNVMDGYDEAGKIPQLTEEMGLKMGQAVFERCMYERTKQKRTGFENDRTQSEYIKVDALSNQSKEARYWQCAQWLEDHIFIGRYAAKGDCEQMILRTEQEPDVDEARREKLLKLMYEA